MKHQCPCVLTGQVQRWRPEAKTTEAWMATYLWFVQLQTFNSRLLATVVKALQVSTMHKWYSETQLMIGV